MKKLKFKNIGIITYIVVVLLLVIAIVININNQSNVFLGCGIFAFVGKSAKDFSWQIFNILGLYNDVRGGDSCGRVIGNTIEKGINSISDYEDLVKGTREPNEASNVVLGHTRKASIGDKTLSNAQPIVLKKSYAVIRKRAKKDKKYKKWIDSLQRNSIVFAGIHNGTIYNYKELAERYHISLLYSNKEEKSDSQILFEILAKGHKEVLSEYYGTAAIIFHSYYENKTYIFRGESSYGISANSYISDEKPLFAWDTKENGYYFSSIRSPLDFMGTKKADITEVVCNTLIGMSKGKIVSEEEVDRSDRSQRKPTSSNRDNVKAYDFSKRKHNHDSFTHPYYLASDYNNYPSDEDEEISSLDRHSLFFTNSSNSKWNSEIMPNVSQSGKNRDFESTSRLLRLQYRRGRYWLNNVILQGMVITSRAGYLIGQDEHTVAGVANYFVDGLLMRNKEAFFKALAERLTKSGTVKSINKYLETVRQYSRYPLCNLSVERADILAPNDYATKWYTGTFQPFYSDREYHVSVGNLTNILQKHGGIKCNTEDEVDDKRLKEAVNFYRSNFASELSKQIRLKDCKGSDPTNKVLMEILRSSEKHTNRYLISKEVSKVTSRWRANREKEDNNKVPKPNIDLEKVEETVSELTDMGEIKEILIGAHPCEHCKEDPNKCKYKVQCEPLLEYSALCRKYLNDEGQASRNQLANDHIRKITNNLLKRIDDTENEISIIGEEEKSGKMVAKLQEIKDILCEETE